MKIHFATFFIVFLPVLTVRLPARFVKGADISWMSEMEAKNRVFRDHSLIERDLVTVLKDLGLDTVRLRVWVNPPDWYNSAEDVVQKAVFARERGMRVMLDFHYSDTWADPGIQLRPVAWKDFSPDELKTAVALHTRTVIQQCMDAGVIPDWVQVGNEVNDGLLWPLGQASRDMAGFASLIKSGYDAVKAVDPGIQVIVHLSNSHDHALYRWIFDGLRNHGGAWDVIGMSCYPPVTDWAAWNEQSLANMNALVVRYGTPVMIVESGMPQNQPLVCQSFLADLIAKTRSVTGGLGLGVIYWEPQSFAWKDYPYSAWEADGSPSLALQAFREGAGKGYFLAPAISRPTFDQAVMTLGFTTIKGQFYQLAVSFDLHYWHPYGTSLTGNGTIKSLSVTNPQGFYRVQTR